MNYKGACKTLLAFENAIKKLIILFENKKEYNDYNYSASKALAYYINTHDIKELINNKAMKDIYINYKDYLKRKRMIIKELEILPDTDNENFLNEKNINTEIDYPSNYITNSSKSESSTDNNNEIIIYDSLSSSEGSKKLNKKKILII